MAIIKAKVELGRNSDVSVSFSVNCMAISHDLLTRVQLYASTILIDSDITPELFDFTRADRLTIHLGQSALVAGRYNCRFYLFDSTNTLGKVWDSDTLELEVCNGQ